MTAKNNKKTFVLDTNVILHDYKSIYNFENNDIVIPIVVLEELDKFKRGNDQINFHAREFVRELDQIAGQDFFVKGASLGKGMGRLFIQPGVPFSDEMKISFSDDIPDHRILAVAEYLSKKKEGEKVILVTKDMNLRMKAKSLGVQAEDYKTDQVKNLDTFLNKSVVTIEDFSPELIAKLYENNGGIPVATFFPGQEIKGNRYYILKNGSNSVLACYDPVKQVVRKVEKLNAFGIYPKNSEQAFAMDALLNPDISLVALSGKAGTGKTLLALAAALQQNKNFEQIYLARPIVALSNKDLGYLPGDATEKVSPYMQPLFDNLGVIKHRYNMHSQESRMIDDMLKDERLVISALAFIRGRSLSDVFFIVDEAQNLTPHEVKTIITRAGEGVKMVFTGDLDQIDSPYLDRQSNGLSHLFDRMEGQDIFAHVHLEKGERSYLAEVASNLL
ncbi:MULTISPECIES: PhoH family protein [Sanguibacteroides]|uniref:Phosphate starvation protein PhoH n=1 Tax=Sanguibacteroides justesenii TaxID=1547597 RepID=A0A0C3MCE6_9PORP|nr:MULTISPECIES: PhoH family protein [Sanguibacteroides]KIO44108.1 phosphate starvation protein PhoH [Sanguibacteroides justesenii]KIO47233.1 phosphate starvation protein PhoH [Sanguibacteroides justesenii]PXZ43857.1 PhoH family protein [Sanguibacteroides justesenii]